MLKFVERLRARPQRDRERIAFAVAGSITGVIFLIWLSAFFVRFEEASAPTPRVERESRVEQFGRDFAEALKGIEERFRRVQF